jgi:uncharacterized protein (DUF1501 family)
MCDCKPCTRRIFLKGSGIALLSLGFGSLGGGPQFLQRAALAAPAPLAFHRRKVLVTVFQRGAMDGLMAVSPLDDAALRRLRPRLAMSAARSAGGGSAARGSAATGERLLDLGGQAGLHPALAPLLPLWQEGRCAVVHSVGSPDPTRSHFDAQDYMETGTPGRKGTASGWLNRVAGELGHEAPASVRSAEGAALASASPFRALAMAPALPRSLYGPAPALAVTDLSTFSVRLPGAPAVAQQAGAGFETLYDETSQALLRETGRETFAAVEMLRRADFRSYRPAAGARYPRSPLGAALQQVAFLVKSDLGLEVAFTETGGWDTHVQQGTAQGSFARRAADLAQSIAAFWTDLGTHQDDVVLMTMTEFGRTVRENGSGGTDHGHGSCLFVVGNQVAGGRVHGQLPSLTDGALYEGRDLQVTTDFRAVFAEVAARHLGVTDAATLFPGWSGGGGMELFRA